MLARAALAAGVQTNLYRCNFTNAGSAPVRASGELAFLNKNSASVKVRAWVSAGPAAPVAGEEIEWDRVIGAAGVPGNGPLIRFVILEPGQTLWVQSDTAGVSASLMAVED